MKSRLWLALAGLVAGVLSGCDYARMTNDEALQTHEQAFPQRPAGVVPVDGGVARERREAGPPPPRVVLPAAETVAAGRRAYGNFCIHCHGPAADGNGTVGQSFAPLPADLAAPAVRGRSDAELFRRISFGFGRHPPLADTVSEADRWAVVAYLRSLPERRPTLSAR